jgi:NAD(P)-dependent dehydrogenase (short-subunit alcohol dehydrogenase family)
MSGWPDRAAEHSTHASLGTVLVTGAGSGLGQAIGLALAERGYRVFGTVRDGQRARELEAAQLGAERPVRYLPLELTSRLDLAAVTATLRSAGGLDALVHNAGFGVFGPVEDVEADAAARQFAVNVLGPLELTRSLLPQLRDRRGRVIWIGSLAGRLALPFQAHYSATKAAIAALSDALRMELAPMGVQVCCVEPGDFATGFTAARVMALRPESVYADAASRCLRAAEREEQSGPEPARVARVVAGLLAQRRMPARRPVGRWARTLCWFDRWLPAGLRQWLLARHFDLHHER